MKTIRYVNSKGFCYSLPEGQAPVQGDRLCTSEENRNHLQKIADYSQGIDSEYAKTKAQREQALQKYPELKGLL